MESLDISGIKKYRTKLSHKWCHFDFQVYFLLICDYHKIKSHSIHLSIANQFMECKIAKKEQDINQGIIGIFEKQKKENSHRYELLHFRECISNNRISATLKFN